MLWYRYTRWDGSQNIFPIHEEEVMDEMAEQLMSHGDVSTALRSLSQRGLKGKDGNRLMGLQDLLQHLRKAKQQTLAKYNLESALDDIQKRLQDVVQTERQGIGQKIEEVRRRYEEAQRQGLGSDAALQEQLLKRLEEMAARHKESLDSLPQETPGALRQLKDYDFMNDEARQKYHDLLQMLQQQALDSIFDDLSKQIQQLQQQDLSQLKDMLRDLNRMLEEHLQGGTPDFQQFMQQYGHYFPQQPSNLDELRDYLQRQMAQMESLLNSLPKDKREALQDLMRSVLQDQELQDILAQIAYNLEQAYPGAFPQQEYPFHGEDPVTLQEAMKLMEHLQKVEELEQDLRRAQQGASLNDISSERAREILDDEAYQALEQLKAMTQLLEDSGYICKTGGRYELTAKGTRRIGQKALQDIFAYIKKDRLGAHRVTERGTGGEAFTETKPYEFGDPFTPDLNRTVLNAVIREGGGVPVRLLPVDFEMYRTEHLAQASTVLMLDLSLSMAMRGNFVAAKKVAMALDNLIRTQFPRDNLFIVGFSTYAREVKPNKLAYLSWDEYDPYTNIQHGLALAERLLTKIKGGTKQIVMISDGEPTAHLEGGQLFLQYPPSPRTIRETLRQVKRCTEKGIVINTFMLDKNSYLVEFVEHLTRINRGRVFYVTPENLGHYILVDYLHSRRRKVIF